MPTVIPTNTIIVIEIAAMKMLVSARAAAPEDPALHRAMLDGAMLATVLPGCELAGVFDRVWAGDGGPLAERVADDVQLLADRDRGSFENTVRNVAETEIHRARIIVIGNGVADLDAREVYIIVPPAGTAILI